MGKVEVKEGLVPSDHKPGYIPQRCSMSGPAMKGWPGSYGQK